MMTYDYNDSDDPVIDVAPFEEPIASDSSQNQDFELTREPLFAALLRFGIDKRWPQQQVLHDFVTLVVPQLSATFAHVTAKGGDFVVERRNDGMDDAKIARFGHDQSMRAHLINGLLPTFHVATQLQTWGAVKLDYFDEVAQRLFCAGFVLHDWVKIPTIDDHLKALGLDHATVNPAHHLPQIEAIFDQACQDLGLHQFLQSLGSPEAYLHDLIYIASNTQIRWGTMHYLAKLPLLNTHYSKQRTLAKDLSNLADYLAYVGRTPRDLVQHQAVRNAIAMLSNGAARLVYHHVSEVRGMLTNMINRTAQELCEINDQRISLLFAPTGTVYLEQVPTEGTLAWPHPEHVAEATIERIKAACRSMLREDLRGIQRDGKGIKYAPFYDLFFSPDQFAELIPRAAREKVRNKTSAAEKRYPAMLEKGMISEDVAQSLPPPTAYTWTIDMIAEGFALLEKKLRDHAPNVLDPQAWLLAQLKLEDLQAEMNEIPKRAKSGGVPYQWYYAAGIAHVRYATWAPEDWNEAFERIALAAQTVLHSQVTSEKFATLQRYIIEHLQFSDLTVNTAQLQELVATELKSYTGAHQLRRATRVCSLCSSAYAIEEQREAGILFAPMVYSNKQVLHGSKATRHICTICEIEMMLRVLLMNRGKATGKNFEARNIRYLFFYPTYFWTAETLEGFYLLSSRLKNLYPSQLRRVLVADQLQSQMVDLDPAHLQRLQSLLLTSENIEQQADVWQRYNPDHAGAFGFLGIPPYGRDSTDSESWVQPTLLALLIPLLIDVKVVASASLLPLMNEATELEQTVLFDSPHQWVTHLIGNEPLNLDQVWRKLKRVIVTTFMHLDANAKPRDDRWNALPALVRDLSDSPLAVFAALKDWQRRHGFERLLDQKVATYLEYKACFDDPDQKGRISMTHAEKLVDLYRQFYRADGYKTNAILRPISIAAEVVLEAHAGLFNPTSEHGAALVQVVYGRLATFVKNVGRGNAGGRYPKGSTHESRDEAIQKFSEYFVKDVYLNVLNGDPAALRGKQLNLLKNACEVLYLAANRKARAAGQSDDDVVVDDDSDV